MQKNRGILEHQTMSTEELLNTLSRCKLEISHRKIIKKLEKIAKIQNISKNELNKAEKLQNKSIDELWGIARLRRIKNYDNLTKEDLIISLLKSEKTLWNVIIWNILIIALVMIPMMIK